MNTFIGSLLLLYQLPAIFLGSFFFGETVIITASFLSGQGVWSLSNVFWFSLAGTVISDAIWFLFGQKIFKLIKGWNKYENKYKLLLVKLKNITGRKPFLSLLFSKFLYGTRILTIFYLSTKKISFWIFIVFDTIGTIFWLTIILLIGWLTGKGIANFINIAHDTKYTLIIIILIIILFKLITSWLEKIIIKK